MKSLRQHIDEFFRERLSNYAETPPADVWETLDKRLDGLGPATPPIPTRWPWHLAIVSLLVLSGVPVLKKLMAGATNSAGNTLTASGEITPGKGDVVQSENPGVLTQSKIAAQTELQLSANDVTAPTAPKTSAEPGAAPQRHNSSNRNFTGNEPGKRISEKPSGQQMAGSLYLTENTHDEYGIKNTPNTLNSTATGSTTTAIASSAATAMLQAAATTSKTTVEIPKTDSTEQKNEVATAAQQKTPAKQANEHKLEAGIKTGYERGGNNAAAQKMVIAPYLQYKLNSRFALMVQPAIKYAAMQTRTIGNPESYYKVLDGGKAEQIGNTQIEETTLGGTIITTYKTKYRYTQSHDSVSKTKTYGASYLEFELPLLLKYDLTKQLAVYGGINLSYSKINGVAEQTSVKKGITRIADTTIVSNERTGALPVNTVLTYSGMATDGYTEGKNTPASYAQFRAGYMVGATYQCGKRWMVDALIQQSAIKANVKSGYNINTPLSATYYRLSVGYKFTK